MTVTPSRPGGIVSVTRILNEDDIVEAFVRHNATHVDRMVFLDNGSTDATLAILHQLHAEGFPLAVFQRQTLIFNEQNANTWLYCHTDQAYSPAWIAFLDTDEFIETPKHLTLAAQLNQLDATIHALKIPLIHYEQTTADDPAEPIVPVRMRWCRQAPTDVTKIFLRGGHGPAMQVAPGNHGASLAGQPLTPALATLALAHYPRRDGYQNLQKIVIGWLKVLAAGQEALTEGRSSHYRSPFETFRDKPHELVANANYLSPPADPATLEEIPLAYRGAPLRYTPTPNPAFKALRQGTLHAEHLATQLAELLDKIPEARRYMEEKMDTPPRKII